MTKELVLTTKDLTDVGISSQLSSNDLLEVVAPSLPQDTIVGEKTKTVYVSVPEVIRKEAKELITNN